MGYLREIIGTQSRYRRCRKSWETHLNETRSAILAAAQRTVSRKKIAVFGSGLLFDVPLADLAEMFEEVILVDIFHMPTVSQAAAKYENVRLVTHDISGVVAPLWEARSRGTYAIPKPFADLPESDADLIVSVNLLTQLPYIPRRFLQKNQPAVSEEDANKFSRDIMVHHVDQLSGASGNICLITEVEHLVCAGDQEIERSDPIQGIFLGTPDREWFWDIAPHPELHRQYDIQYRVIARISA
ncbi:MAG: hypothetical protein ISR47_05755 [Rhodospirillales bacterium]|nr:hypothetical protein [Rhodospirillales bacterium]